MHEPLKNCPFCGAGESQIHVNKGTWNGRGYGEPVSVEVRHWCADVPGQPSRMISRAGRDEASAIAAWNTRTTPQPAQAQAGAAPLTDEMASKAGRALSDLYATECGVEKEDNWKVYGSDFIATAKLVLEAVGIKGGQHGTE